MVCKVGFLYTILCCTVLGARRAQLVEHRTHEWKVANPIYGRSGRGIFFSRFNFLCWLLFSVHSTAVVTAVACQRLRSFYQKCRWQVSSKPALTQDPMKSVWTAHAVQAKCGNLERKLARKQRVGEHSATVISVCWAIMDWSWHKEWNWCVWAELHLKNKTKRRWGLIWHTFPRILVVICKEKSHHHLHHHTITTVLRRPLLVYPVNLARFKGPDFCCCCCPK